MVPALPTPGQIPHVTSTRRNGLGPRQGSGRRTASRPTTRTPGPHVRREPCLRFPPHPAAPADVSHPGQRHGGGNTVSGGSGCRIALMSIHWNLPRRGPSERASSHAHEFFVKGVPQRSSASPPPPEGLAYMSPPGRVLRPGRLSRVTSLHPGPLGRPIGWRAQGDPSRRLVESGFRLGPNVRSSAPIARRQAVRVMLIITGDSEPGAAPSDELLSEMGKFNDLTRASRSCGGRLS